jgi:hypothetical protein
MCRGRVVPNFSVSRSDNIKTVGDACIKGDLNVCGKLWGHDADFDGTVYLKNPPVIEQSRSASRAGDLENPMCLVSDGDVMFHANTTIEGTVVASSDVVIGDVETRGMGNLQVNGNSQMNGNVTTSGTHQIKKNLLLGECIDRIPPPFAEEDDDKTGNLYVCGKAIIKCGLCVDGDFSVPLECGALLVGSDGPSGSVSSELPPGDECDVLKIKDGKPTWVPLGQHGNCFEELCVEGKTDLKGDLCVDGCTSLECVCVSGCLSVDEDLTVCGDTHLEHVSVSDGLCVEGYAEICCDRDVCGTVAAETVNVASNLSVGGCLSVDGLFGQSLETLSFSSGQTGASIGADHFTSVVNVSGASGASSGALSDGSKTGQVLYVIADTLESDYMLDLSGTSLVSSETAVLFDTSGGYIQLMWLGTKWVLLSYRNVGLM